MKKRKVRRDESPSVKKPPKLQQKKEVKTSRSWKKIILLSLAAVAMLGFSVMILPELIQQFAFMYRLRLPYFVDLSEPADFSLNHTVNLYLSPEEGISLGVWLTVPDSQWKETQGKDLNWYQKSLGDGNPVFIYLHGNTKNRISTDLAVKLLEKGVVLDGVMLEGTFNSARGKIPFNPFYWFYFSLPGIKYLFIGEGSIFQSPVFPTEENVKKMESPILFLHSEDDHMVPIEVVEELHEIAASAQNKDRVKLVKFDGSKGYLHNGLYRDAKLPGVIKDFVKSL